MNPLFLLYTNYLFENGYKTYSEVMKMTFEEAKAEFFKITRNEDDKK